MPKRFTGTEIWEEDWFLDMPDAYKLFWFYMLAKCDHSGIFKVNINKFNLTLESKKKITSNNAFELFNSGKIRIRILAENRWFVEDFFVFQYGENMNLNNKLHESIQNIYNQANINLRSIRGLKDLKDRVKDKEKEIKKGGVGENIKGVEFNAEKTAVKLSDGTTQKLGKWQKFRITQGDLTPEGVDKGIIS